MAGFPKPEITWEFEENPLNENLLEDGSIEQVERILKINSFSEKFEGNYKCVGVNDGGRKEISLQLKMNG